MKTAGIACAIALVACGSAVAQSNTDACRAVAAPANSAADASMGYLDAVKGMDFGALRQTLVGEDLTALDALIEAREGLLGPMTDFSNRLEDFAYRLKKCARS